jgi:hypothetical protein
MHLVHSEAPGHACFMIFFEVALVFVCYRQVGGSVHLPIQFGAR